MNDTIRTQLAHSSVRAFTNEPVTAELRTQILDAARAASTSCALQVTSIIRVTDPALRARIAELSGGQVHVEPHLNSGSSAPTTTAFSCSAPRPTSAGSSSSSSVSLPTRASWPRTPSRRLNPSGSAAASSEGSGTASQRFLRFCACRRTSFPSSASPSASRRAQSRQAAAARHHHLHGKRLRRTRASRT